MKNTTLNKCEKLKTIRSIKHDLTRDYGCAEINIEIKWWFCGRAKTVNLDKNIMLQILDQHEKELEQEIREEVLNDDGVADTDELGLQMPKVIKPKESKEKEHE